MTSIMHHVMRHFRVIFLFTTLWFFVSSACAQSTVFDGELRPEGDSLAAIELYSQDELIKLINQNLHLQRVKRDRCQLVKDIEARATVMEVPAYQFLWGDMLAWGVCVGQDPKLGIYYMQASADQGFPAGLEHLGRYYYNGILVMADSARGIRFLREASALGSQRALLQLADIHVNGQGSAHDLADIYIWLNQIVTADNSIKRQVDSYINRIGMMMNLSTRRQAKRTSRLMN